MGIWFGCFTEPFINSDCTNMIESAISKGFKVRIFSTLVGMKAEDVERLSKMDIQEFTLHLPDNKNNTKIPVNTQMYKDTLALVLQKLRIDNFSVMNENFIDNERAGTTRTARGTHMKGMYECFKLVHPQFAMLPNCDVALCCNDFGLKHILGNLLTQSYDEIVNSKEFRRIRADRLKFDSKDILCRNCMFAVPIFEYYTFQAAIALVGPVVKDIMVTKYWR